MARHFNNSGSSYIDLGDLTNVKFLQAQTWTFLTFFKVDAFGDDDKGIINRWGNGDRQCRIRIRQNGGSESRLQIATNNGVTINTGTVIATDTWYLLGISNDGTGGANGVTLNCFELDKTAIVDADTGDHNGDWSGLVNTVRIGTSRDTVEPFEGDMAFSCYITQVLTQAQMRAFIDNPYDVLRMFKGSVEFFLPLDASSPAVDLSGNANNGTLNGTVTHVNHPPVGAFLGVDTPSLFIASGGTPQFGTAITAEMATAGNTATITATGAANVTATTANASLTAITANGTATGAVNQSATTATSVLTAMNASGTATGIVTGNGVTAQMGKTAIDANGTASGTANRTATTASAQYIGNIASGNSAQAGVGVTAQMGATANTAVITASGTALGNGVTAQTNTTATNATALATGTANRTATTPSAQYVGNTASGDAAQNGVGVTAQMGVTANTAIITASGTANRLAETAINTWVSPTAVALASGTAPAVAVTAAAAWNAINAQTAGKPFYTEIQNARKRFLSDISPKAQLSSTIDVNDRFSSSLTPKKRLFATLAIKKRFETVISARKEN